MSLHRLFTFGCVLSIVIMASCSVSNRNIKIKSTVVDTAEIKKFLQSKHSFSIDTVNDLGDRVVWSDDSVNDEYQKNVYKKNSAYKHCYVYDRSTFQLKSTSVIFYNFPVGKIKYYNTQGKVTRTEDSETDVAFKADALVDLLKRMYDVDLLSKNSNYSSVYKIRYDDSEKIVYQVLYGHNDRNMTRRKFIVDAQTGQVLFDKWIPVIE
jgi:hypothetical protein